MTIACRTQRGNCLLKQWSLETTPTKSTYQIQQTSQCHCEGTDGDSCSSWKSCPFMGANNFIQKWEKTSNRKEVEPCLQYISSLKLPQREALRNIGPINAPIWSNLSVLNSVIKLPFYVELSVACLKHWSLETTPTKSTYQIQQTSECHCEGTDGDSSSSWKSCPFWRLKL